jgi:diguanylate cyclase (GGDEF)-like protein/PAS domain S-box-containing protein
VASDALPQPMPTDDSSADAKPSLDLTQTLQLVADTIVESLGFEVAVINLIDGIDGSMVIAAVAGPVEVRDALLNRRQGSDGWAQLVAASEPWGRLLFLDHAKSTIDPSDVFTWIPDMEVSDDPNAWHPEDSLFAPLESSDGVFLGMLSVDVPRDGMRPGAATRHAMEAFAVTASLAIQHAGFAAEARRGAQRFQAVFDSSPIAIGLLGADRRYASVNDALCKFWGRSREAIVGHAPSEFSHPDDVGLTMSIAETVWGSGPVPATALSGPVEKRYLLPDGTTVWGRLHLAPLDNVDEKKVVIAQIEDITERKRTQERLVQQAHFDALTSLPNRSESMRRLRAALAADVLAGTTTVVFFCDLDRLKLVNDGHGHAVGDAYLTEISRRIRASVRESDVVGRLSGDEFVVIVQGVRQPAEALGLAGRVIDGVHQPLRLGGISLSPSISLGIAYSDGPDTTADGLLAQADSAMYKAKAEQRGAWHVYDPTMRNSAAAQLELRSDVARGLREEQFVLYYQPIVRLADRAVIGHEALLRWQHPRHGLLAPAQFLDVILDSEYESLVTDWVIGRACLDTASRPAASRKVNVNVSSLQVGRSDLPDVIRRSLALSGLEPSDLVLELTEDRLLARADGAQLLQALRDLGVSIAIDDFGTGYGGLGYLQRFSSSINIVKLDRSFITEVDRDVASEQIVRAVVELTRGCGLLLVAEGVETEQQAAVLQRLGVPYVQGYLFGRPAPHTLCGSARRTSPHVISSSA